VRLVVDVDSDPSTRPHIRVDPEHRLAGRGAWIHPTQQCWYKALQKNAFARAFRRPVAADRAPGPFAITESG
jgi:predicted RNA-binding protein YlxR (DUF448 family)